jgi:hypothetical protein
VGGGLSTAHGHYVSFFGHNYLHIFGCFRKIFIFEQSYGVDILFRKVNAQDEGDGSTDQKMRLSKFQFRWHVCLVFLQTISVYTTAQLYYQVLWLTEYGE